MKKLTSGINTFTSDKILGIIGRDEMWEYTLSKISDLNFNINNYSDIALISITDPDKNELYEDVVNLFDNKLKVKFHDVEEDYWIYNVISEDIANTIKIFNSL